MRKIGRIFRFLILVIALVALVVFLAGAGRRKRAKEIRAKIRIIEKGWNTQNLDLFDEVYAPHFVSHSAPFPDTEGLEAFKQKAAEVFKAFPDFQLTFHEIIVEGDTHAAPWTWQGTHTGESAIFPPPTGKKVTGTGLCYGHWEDGKVVEAREYEDHLGVMQQLGFKLVPAK